MIYTDDLGFSDDRDSWSLEIGFLCRTVPPAATTRSCRYPLYEGMNSPVK